MVAGDQRSRPDRLGAMPVNLERARPPDPGLTSLVMLLRFHGIGADTEQIRHQFGVASFGIPEMIRCAKELGLRARAVTTRWGRLAKIPMPVIASLRGGGFLILGKVGEGKALVQAPSS